MTLDWLRRLVWWDYDPLREFKDIALAHSAKGKVCYSLSSWGDAILVPMDGDTAITVLQAELIVIAEYGRLLYIEDCGHVVLDRREG